MYEFTLEVEGTMPLLMHNPRMVDPEFYLNRQIKQLTSKRKKSDEDLAAIEWLEWLGGLYVAGEQLVQPSSKIHKALTEAGRITKEGKQVERAISFPRIDTPLIFDKDNEGFDEDGCRGLYLADGRRYVSRLSVGLRGKRVMRCRPEFPVWKLEVEGLFIPDAGLNFEDIERLANLAGQAIGIGDNRVNGYGRFEAKVMADVLA